MFAGIVVGAAIWFFFLFLGILLEAIFGDLTSPRAEITFGDRSALFWIIVFAFVGGIIGQLVTLTISFN